MSHSFVTYANVPDALTLSNADITRLCTEARATGFEAARLRVPWNAVHTAPGTFSWAAVDQAVNAALGANLAVMLVLAPPAPSWVTTVTRQVQFTAFAEAVASRYRVGGHGIAHAGRSVAEYQVWDEPNAITANWPTTSTTPQKAAVEYANLLKAASPGIKRNSPGARVIFAGLRASARNVRTMAITDPSLFLSDAYSVARPYFDAVAYHPLSLPTAQFPNPPAPSANLMAQSDAVRTMMVRRGDAAKKLYWTQVGYDLSTETTTQQSLYTDSIRWFAQKRRDHIAAIGLDYRDNSRTAGLVAANWSPRPAKATVARWHDGVKRHTLYTVCGTQQDGWGLVPTVMTPAEQQSLLDLYHTLGGTGTPTPGEFPGDYRSPDTVMGTRANPALFNWVPVSYPASAPIGAAVIDNGWQPQTISMADSFNLGVKELVSLIQNTPGTFALAGMSQGAGVISQVLRQMQPRGQLASRANDCIAAVAFGNPCRKPNTGIPGLSGAASGAGLISGTGSVPGLTNIMLPSWWWELCTPGDPVGAAPITGPAGRLITSVCQSLLTLRTGGGSLDLVRLLPNIITALSSRGAILPVIFAAAQFAISRLFRTTTPVIAALESWLNEQASYGVNNPHLMYGTWSPPVIPPGLGLSAGASYIDVGAAYLNARGAAIAPR